MENKNEFVYMYFLTKKVMEDNKVKFEVKGEDGFTWAEAGTPAGALMGSLACGLQLRDIKIPMFVPDFGKVLSRAGGR